MPPLADISSPSDSGPADAVQPAANRGLISMTALVVGAVACVAYAARGVTDIGGEVFSAALLGVALGGAVVSCGVARLGRSRARSAWGLLAVAIAGYGLSSIAYTLVPGAADFFPSVYDLGLFVFYPLVFAALVAFVRRQVLVCSGAMWIDAVLGAVVLAAVGAAAVWPLLDGESSAAVLGQLFYFLGDLGFLGFLLAAYAVSGWRDGSSLLFLAAGSAVLAVADSVWVIEVAHGAGAPGLSALLWPAGLLLFAVAPHRPVRGVPLSSSTWAKIGVPGVSAIACLPVLLLAERGTPEDELASVGLALVVVRLMMSLRENTQLFGSIQQAAITDPLTGLANRRLLADRLEQALARQSRRGETTAILFIDLDEFKAINDAYGHVVGDQVLVAVGERLRNALRSEDTLARNGTSASFERRDTIGRLGGDEFVVLLEGLEEGAHAGGVAERILAVLRAPLVLAPHELSLDASIGVTLAGDGGAERSSTEILRDADTAMYAAKRAGKGRYELFEANMREQVIARADLIRDLRSAVDHGQLRLVYQPQVDLTSGRMTGVEALVRWQHPERGLITPDEFVPVAESTGIIVAIDDWVLREACTQLRAWDDAGLAPLHMAVNVSARRLVTDDLACTISSVLRDTGLRAGRLEIELTETVAVERDGEAAAAITRVRELGVEAAIDDFGIGHSALSRLQSFPVDRIKIDRTFVAPLVYGAERGSIADAMLAIAQSLGLQVVAEGIETQAHLRSLRSLGCPAGQGYLFSRPVSAEEIERLSRAGTALTPPANEREALPDVDLESATLTRERLTRNLLAELERVTGLESTYLTRIDWDEAVQTITHARNTGTIEVPEGLTVNWSDTVCRRALEQGVAYTDDVPASFPDSQAGEDLGLQTYLSVPVVDERGEITGTLCGASTRRIQLGPDAIRIMERFAHLLTRGVGVWAANDGWADSPTGAGRRSIGATATTSRASTTVADHFSPK